MEVIVKSQHGILYRGLGKYLCRLGILKHD